MTPEQTALARKLVAHSRWTAAPTPIQGYRWPYPVDSREPDGCRWVRVPADAPAMGLVGGDWLPDLTDAATGGVLLSMLLGDYHLVTAVSPTGPDDAWNVEVYHHATETTPRIDIDVTGATLGEACAKALLALDPLPSFRS